MKKIVLVAILFIAGASISNAQSKASAKVSKAKKEVKAKIPTVTGAGMVFENETIDYGTIKHNADGNRKFVLVNNGDQPLVISSASGSCGCTVPSAPKEPIAPGAKAFIDVKYATDRVGPFTKTVTVNSNAVQGASKTLTIKGEVLPDTTNTMTTSPAKS